MNPAIEHQRIEEDLSRVQALLEKLPPSRVLERIGFEARRDELRQALDALEPGSATPEAPEARKAPEATDATGSRRRLIEEELSELDTLLARLPERRVLERAGLEARREGLREELAKSELALVKAVGASMIHYKLDGEQEVRVEMRLIAGRELPGNPWLHDARLMTWVLSGTTVLTLAALFVALLGASSLLGVLGLLLVMSLGLNIWSVLRVRSLGSAAQTTRAPQSTHRPRAS